MVSNTWRLWSPSSKLRLGVGKLPQQAAHASMAPLETLDPDFLFQIRACKQQAGTHLFEDQLFSQSPPIRRIRVESPVLRSKPTKQDSREANR